MVKTSDIKTFESGIDLDPVITSKSPFISDVEDNDSVFSSRHQGINQGKSKRMQMYDRILAKTGTKVLPQEFKVGQDEQLTVLMTKEEIRELDYFQNVDFSNMIRYDAQTA